MAKCNDTLPQIRGRPPPRESDLEGTKEMEVVKIILLREEYIARIKANLTRQGSKFGKDQGALEDVLSLLDQLRSTTIDTVEIIQHWRRFQGCPGPFIWRGMSYLLRIPIDLDFLNRHQVQHTATNIHTLL